MSCFVEGGRCDSDMIFVGIFLAVFIRFYSALGIKENSSQPQPYEFAYEVKDDYGTEHFRKEASDGYGNVKGEYGYTDEHGLYRHVLYEASKEYGFRANVKTNEPGTDNQDPADVHFEVEKQSHVQY